MFSNSHADKHKIELTWNEELTIERKGFHYLHKIEENSIKRKK